MHTIAGRLRRAIIVNNTREAVPIPIERRTTKHSIIEEVRRSLGGGISQCQQQKNKKIAIFLRNRPIEQRQTVSVTK